MVWRREARPLNETNRKFATDVFQRPTPGPVSLNADALAHALQFNQRMADALRAPDSGQRKRIWELSSNLHCSIVGTCFSTAELRQLLVKLDIPGAVKATDHDLHGQAVSLAANRAGGAKHLQKALDRRHRTVVGQFEKARSEDAVRKLWDAALERGDIPGAYWATLTHPKSGHGLVRHVFAEVHMLSHLVGAANRADIRRLKQLEAEKAELEDKVAKQQARLRDAILERDTTIRNLNQALAERLGQRPADNVNIERGTLEKLIVDLKDQLSREADQRARAEDRLKVLELGFARSETARKKAEGTVEELKIEIVGAEQALTRMTEPETIDAPRIDLAGLCILYVGGKNNLLAPMKSTTEECAAQLLHHDGGVEASMALLPGLITRADLVIFPVDCVSHEATVIIKRLCRQTGKRYLPLRSAGLTSYVAALQKAAVGAWI